MVAGTPVDPSDEADRVRAQAVELLRLAALPAHELPAAFPSFVICTDEVAELFDESSRLLRSRVAADDPVLAAVVRIVAIFERHPGSGEFWAVDALRTHPDWAAVREAAAAALDALAEPVRSPALGWVHYVPGAPGRGFALDVRSIGRAVRALFRRLRR